MAMKSALMLRKGLENSVEDETFRQLVLAIRDIMHECGSDYKWLLDDCGRMLSDYIMNNNGLKYVLQGYLDGIFVIENDIIVISIFYCYVSNSGTFSGKDADVLQEKIAYTVTSVPSKISKADYYSTLCPQVLHLICTGYESKDEVSLRYISLVFMSLLHLSSTTVTFAGVC